MTVVATSFHTVTVNAASGTTDTANLNGLSSSVNTYTTTPTSASLAGTGYNYIVNGFTAVNAYSANSGDVANMSTVSGSNTFVGTSTYASLSGPMGGKTYLDYAYNFARVNATSGAGATDTANVYGTSGTDAFNSTSTVASMSGSGYFNQVTRFRSVNAFAGSGNDSATITDATTGSETLTVNNTVGGVQSNMITLVGANYSTSVNFGFKTVTVNGSASGNDTANLFDTSGNDALFAAGDQLQLVYNSAALTLNLTGYKTINAKSINGGTDTATVRSVDYALNVTGNWINK